MNKKILATFYALLLKDITIFNKRLVYRSIDALAWMTSILLVAQYIMPMFGVTDPQYGTFTLIGNLAVWGLFEMLTSIAMFLGDMQGDKAISYYMSLPLPSWMMLTELAVASAYRSLASSFFLLPLGKIILGDNLILSNIHWPYFILAMIILNLFYGFFTIFVASYVSDLTALTMVRSRIMFPLWFLGGFQFPWKMLHTVSPTFAYINLCNPIVYIMDGLRSTALPTENYIPFWNCMGMLILFSILFGYLGIQKLKKRLDCI
ncbi:ABC transporter permease [Candidatus Babeliales bacterium]|nr:ABC transporter permease [Candidatus Babeliales bacterium]MBP9843653.1 ABC transporter permease [Candidatus Babeliales bacterium]